MATDSNVSTFDEMWKIACERFEEQTGKRPDQEPTMTLDDCKNKIEDAQTSDNGGGNHDKMKEYGLKALEYLKILGGVVAEGAGTVCCLLVLYQTVYSEYPLTTT